MSCAFACYEIETAMKVVCAGTDQGAIRGSFDPHRVQPTGEMSQATQLET